MGDTSMRQFMPNRGQEDHLVILLIMLMNGVCDEHMDVLFSCLV